MQRLRKLSGIWLELKSGHIFRFLHHRSLSHFTYKQLFQKGLQTGNEARAENMVTADADINMAGPLGFAALSAFLILSGIGFGIWNLSYILRKSDPKENVYGKPMPFNSSGRISKRNFRDIE